MNEQQTLFNLEENWREEWEGMPEFELEDKSPIKQITISFKTTQDLKDFGKLINQPITPRTKSLWFPQVKNTNNLGKRYKTEENE